jgi:hypothetical protein
VLLRCVYCVRCVLRLLRLAFIQRAHYLLTLSLSSYALIDTRQFRNSKSAFIRHPAATNQVALNAASGEYYDSKPSVVYAPTLIVGCLRAYPAARRINRSKIVKRSIPKSITYSKSSKQNTHLPNSTTTTTYGKSLMDSSSMTKSVHPS